MGKTMTSGTGNLKKELKNICLLHIPASGNYPCDSVLLYAYGGPYDSI